MREGWRVVPIDTEEVRSPGWWMKRLSIRLADPARARRLQLLWDYHRGHAPLPVGSENARSVFQAFQKKARSNFGELIVSAVSERMTPVGFRTALDSDATGDKEVGQLWKQSGLDVTAGDVHDHMLALGEAFVIVGAVDEDTGAPTITFEDPRYMVSEQDAANERKMLAAMKLIYDDVSQEDRAYLYLPGQVWVARRAVPKTRSATSTISQPQPYQRRAPIMFDGRSWEWDTDRSGALEHGRIPVVRFVNKYGMGEFEAHTDLLDRINKEILDRLVISAMQAFRQRAIKNMPTTYPEDYPDQSKAGQPIDYDKMFSADPAALWLLPEDAEMWESAFMDLRPILEAVKDDLEHLAAVTRTPLHMLSAGGVNQSAEGASLAREGLTFKVEDRQKRTGHPWAQVMSLALLVMGEQSRADMAKLQTIWARADRLSLTEKADAAVKLAQILPLRTLLIMILDMPPDEADRAMSEIEEQRLVALIQAQALGAAAGQPGQQQGQGGQPAVAASTPSSGPPVQQQPSRELVAAGAGR